MFYQALTTAAGRFCWKSGDIVEIVDRADAKELLAINAIRLVKPEAKPNPKEKTNSDEE